MHSKAIYKDLILAIEENNKDTCKKILSNMDTETANKVLSMKGEKKKYFTPIVYAAKLNHIKIVELIAKKFADRNGDFMFHGALIFLLNELSTAKIILQKCGNFSVRLNSKEGPLHILNLALSNDDGKRSINFLLDFKQGSLVNTFLKFKKFNEHTVMMQAATLAEQDPSYFPIVKRMAIATSPHANEEDIGNYGFALHSAAKCHQTELIKPLLDAGASLTYQNELGEYPLETACKFNAGDAALMLLKASKVILNFENSLIYAIKNNNYVLIKALLEKNENEILCYHSSCKKGNIFIYEALAQNNAPVLKLLLQKIKLEMIDVTQDGKNPLAIAQELNAFSCLPLLQKKSKKEYLLALHKKIKHHQWKIPTKSYKLTVLFSDNLAKQFNDEDKYENGKPDGILAIETKLQFLKLNDEAKCNFLFYEIKNFLINLTPSKIRHPEYKEFILLTIDEMEYFDSSENISDSCNVPKNQYMVVTDRGSYIVSGEEPVYANSDFGLTNSQLDQYYLQNVLPQTQIVQTVTPIYPSLYPTLPKLYDRSINSNTTLFSNRNVQRPDETIRETPRYIP